jgi:hypothetical protein
MSLINRNCYNITSRTSSLSPPYLLLLSSFSEGLKLFLGEILVKEPIIYIKKEDESVFRYLNLDIEIRNGFNI